MKQPNSIFRSIVPAIALALAMVIPTTSARADEAALERIHQEIVKRFKYVKHITSDALTEKLKVPGEADDIVLFDVREVDEHWVSHLRNAHQLKPGIWTSTFMKKHGARIKGKTVVFYCSVGQRSSYVASYLQDTLMKSGAKGVLNLKGGIFSWHNQSRPLKSGPRATDYVHPYDKYWGKLVERKNLIRFKLVKFGAGATPALAPTSQ